MYACICILCWILGHQDDYQPDRHRLVGQSLMHLIVYGRFPKFHRVLFGPRPWHIEIRHRVKQTYTIKLFGFETLKLTIRRLKLWKPTVIVHYSMLY